MPYAASMVTLTHIDKLHFTTAYILYGKLNR